MEWQRTSESGEETEGIRIEIENLLANLSGRATAVNGDLKRFPEYRKKISKRTIFLYNLFQQRAKKLLKNYDFALKSFETLKFSDTKKTQQRT